VQPEFRFDVFLSHSAKDKAAVRAVAERLRQDGLTVWPVAPKRLREGGFNERDPAKAKGGKPKSASELQPSAFSLQPFPDTPIKGFLAQAVVGVERIGVALVLPQPERNVPAHTNLKTERETERKAVAAVIAHRMELKEDPPPYGGGK
jgi:hypothetical protein